MCYIIKVLWNEMSQLTKFVAFRETIEIVELLDQVVTSKGIDRSDFIREAIRKQLAELSFLSPADKKALGVKEAVKAEQWNC